MEDKELLEYADKYASELVRGMCFEVQMSLPSNLQDNIKAGTVTTKEQVKEYCNWYLGKAYK